MIWHMKGFLKILPTLALMLLGFAGLTLLDWARREWPMAVSLVLVGAVVVAGAVALWWAP